MTKTLQDLIDESIFISTEYQARLAELTGDSEWSVDFSAPSFTLSSDDSVALSPYLLGTESESRGSWIWSWQELGHFPDSVVSAAIQAREAGSQHGISKLTTDELVLEDGLARRLTLATKAVTGIYAHYPVQAGAGVRAWLLLDGDLLELEAPTVNRMGRVMAQALQTGTAVNHLKAVDSYARLRGAHIEWDTEATAVITATDGALRLWFDEGKISGIEPAEPTVDADELNRCAAHAASLREQMRSERSEVERIAASEAAQHSAAREEAAAREAAAARQAEAEAAAQRETEQEAREEAARAEREAAEREAAEREAREAEEVEGTTTTDRVYTDVSDPYDQDPRDDAQPGRVTTGSFDDAAVAEDRDADEFEQIETEEVQEAPATTERETVEVDEAEESHEAYKPAAFRVAGEAPDLEAEREEAEHAPKKETKEKKGFFSRFFGL